MALQIAGDIVALEKVEVRYRQDWVSSGDTSGYYLITWVELHVAYGRTKGLSPWPTLPITPDKLHAVGSLLKAGGYRSPKNYLQSAKNAHVEAGFSWNDSI